MNANKERILVVFSRVDVTHRLMLEGLLRYVRERCADRWQILLDRRDIYDRTTSELAGGGFSGIIAAVGSASDRKRYLSTGLPTVLFEPTLSHLSQRRRPKNNVTFFNDHAAEGRTAAEYFLSMRFDSFAYVGTLHDTSWSKARAHGFASRLRVAGYRPTVYRPPADLATDDFSRELPSLSAWLRTLPRRTALFAAHDERALQAMAAAAQAGLAIPGDLAVLGVDDDDLLCTTASPTLSSIPVNAMETGRRIAEAMHALLEGRPTEPVIRTCHTRVISRLSTDAFSCDDPIVARALDYMQKHLAEPITVKNLVAAANCSRRTLEMKLRSATGTSPADKLRELRQAEAVKLLAETRLPVAEVARTCGFGTSAHLANVFRSHGLPAPATLRTT